jgi:hypothetical protein
MLNAACPADLDPVVMRALARRPEERYATASQFALALEDWILRSQQPASQAHLAAFLRAAYPDYKERSRARGESTPASGLEGTFIRTPTGERPQPSGLTGTVLTPERSLAPPPATPAPGAPSTPAPPVPSSRLLKLAALAASCVMLASGAALLVRPDPPSHAATPASPPAPPPAPALHVLRITSEPSGAEVLVGGSPSGKTPLELPFEHGKHVDLTIQAHGMEPVRHTHEVLGAAELPFKLQRKQATLTLVTRPPGASVLRDGQSLGVTPLSFTGDAELPVRLVLSLKGYTRKEVEIIPRDGATQEFELVRQSSVRDDSPFKTKAER